MFVKALCAFAHFYDGAEGKNEYSRAINLLESIKNGEKNIVSFYQRHSFGNKSKKDET